MGGMTSMHALHARSWGLQKDLHSSTTCRQVALPTTGRTGHHAWRVLGSRLDWPTVPWPLLVASRRVPVHSLRDCSASTQLVIRLSFL